MRVHCCFILLFCVAFAAKAQTHATQLKLQKGQKIRISSKDTSNSTQKRGEESMEMKSIAESAIEFEVIGVEDKRFKAIQTLKSMKLDFDGYGQKMTYNSTDPGKQEGMLAEQIKKVIDKPDTLYITFDGKREEADEKDEKKDKNKGRGNMMRMLGQGGSNIENAFLLVPAEAKEGSGWKLDNTRDEVRSQTIYFVEKIEGNTATVSFKRKTKGTINRIGGGMGDMKIDLDNLSSGLIQVELNSGLVKSYYESVNNKSTTSMQGQEMPSTGVTSSAVKFE